MKRIVSLLLVSLLVLMLAATACNKETVNVTAKEEASAEDVEEKMGDADEGEVPAVNGETSPAPGETAEGKAAEDKDEAQADKEEQAETAKPADKKKDNTGAEQKKDGPAATKKPDAAPAKDNGKKDAQQAQGGGRFVDGTSAGSIKIQPSATATPAPKDTGRTTVKENVAAIEQPAEYAKLGAATGYIRSTGNLAIRTGPGAKYTQIGTATRDVVFRAYTVKDGWTQVNLGDGITGWISNKNVVSCDANGYTEKEKKELEAQQANARELEALSKLGSPSGYVKTIGNANVRTGPGAKYDKIGSLPKNVLFTAYAVKDGWTQVDVGGFGAWIANSNLASCDANGLTEAEKKPVQTAQPTATPKPQETNDYSKLGAQSGYVRTREAVNVRSGPGTNYSVIAKAAKNEFLTTYSKVNGWTQVVYKGQIGWIADSKLIGCDSSGLPYTEGEFIELEEEGTGSNTGTEWFNPNTGKWEPAPGGSTEPQKPKPTDTVTLDSGKGSRILSKINEARAEHGLGALSEAGYLSESARSRAKHCAEQRYIAHDQDYAGTGEILAQGKGLGASGAVKGWLNSSAHRPLVLKDGYVKFGVGVYEDSNGEVYACVLFDY